MIQAEGWQNRKELPDCHREALASLAGCLMPVQAIRTAASRLKVLELAPRVRSHHTRPEDKWTGQTLVIAIRLKHHMLQAMRQEVQATT